MRIKRNFFNSSNGEIYWNYSDTNNYLFIIFFDSGATLNFILRDLKKNENIKNYIYKKINTRFINVAEIEISKISYIEYQLMKQNKVPSVIKIC